VGGFSRNRKTRGGPRNQALSGDAALAARRVAQVVRAIISWKSDAGIRATRTPNTFAASRGDLRRLASVVWTPHFNARFFDGDWSCIALRSQQGCLSRSRRDLSHRGRDSSPLILSFDISQLPNPKNWGMADASRWVSGRPRDVPGLRRD